MSYNYTTKTGTLKAFLERVKSKDLGVPDKVTQAYLESINYKSKHDRTIIRVLKSINFIDDNGVPTQNFKDFRTDKSKEVMANAIRKTYAELFKTYSNPVEKSRGELEDFFAKTETSVTKQTLGLYVDTFKTLCEFADFGAISLAKGEVAEEKEEKAVVGVGRQVISQAPAGITINLNVQITLPVTDDAKVYENIFKALKEQLFSRG
jgi:hypothetical protein